LFTSWPGLHLDAPPLFQVELERRLGVGGHALMLGCPEHWTVQP